MSGLGDLNKALFAQLDRLSNASKEDLANEVIRAQNIEIISEQIIKAHETQLAAAKLVAEYKGLDDSQKAPLLDVKYEG
ncbi:hypothetical protein AAV96_08920 [Acinetobacter sp. AG1]|jgi:hypothetical protein|uniref:hypothetical protein n=1 Tax=Acinetobacter TaxID=469 RepID=UPI000629D0E2|nr:hypothetical protein [Acinetobacter sp. AG1]KKW79014.1 hypothetical protein AAV96_08920 [Acinetobacter sp. AG1]